MAYPKKLFCFSPKTSKASHRIHPHIDECRILDQGSTASSPLIWVFNPHPNLKCAARMLQTLHKVSLRGPKRVLDFFLRQMRTQTTQKTIENTASMPSSTICTTSPNKCYESSPKNPLCFGLSQTFIGSKTQHLQPTPKVPSEQQAIFLSCSRLQQTTPNPTDQTFLRPIPPFRGSTNSKNDWATFFEEEPFDFENFKRLPIALSRWYMPKRIKKKPSVSSKHGEKHRSTRTAANCDTSARLHRNQPHLKATKRLEDGTMGNEALPRKESDSFEQQSLLHHARLDVRQWSTRRTLCPLQHRNLTLRPFRQYQHLAPKPFQPHEKRLDLGHHHKHRLRRCPQLGSLYLYHRDAASSIITRTYKRPCKPPPMRTSILFSPREETKTSKHPSTTALPSAISSN